MIDFLSAVQFKLEFSKDLDTLKQKKKNPRK